MTTFPEIIKIKVTNEITDQPVSGIAILIKLFANHKNDYSLLPPLSDQNGNIEISREWLVQKILETSSLALMDYSSNLEDCQPKFELRVLDKEAITTALLALEIYKAGLPTLQNNIDSLLRARNSKYSSCIELINLSGEKTENVLVKIKKLQ